MVLAGNAFITIADIPPTAPPSEKLNPRAVKMAAATQGYMSDILKTPGFFTAAIAADGDNVFEQAFKSQNDGSLLHPLDIGGIQQHQQMMRDAHNDNNNNFFLQNSNDRAFTPLFSYPKTSQYANPLRHPTIPSPPTSAIQSPHDWPYSDFDQHRSRRSNLHTLATQNHPGTPRMHYGQVTPPDDQLSSAFDYDKMPPEFMQQRPAQASQQQPENNSGKRKRPSNGSANEASPESSKRSRRSTARSKAQAAAQLDLHNPEDEKRSKFLERNRVAASKCRQKKKEWTNNLEVRARDLQNSKNQLALIVGSLKNEVMFLKGQMLRHTGCGCSQIREYLTHEADNIASASHASHKKFESAASPIGSAPNSRPGSVSDNSSERHVSRRSSFNLDELGSPHDESAQKMTSHMHFKSEKELEALLTSQLVQDTSDQGIASRVSRT
ncbi:hypothetical protein MMC30_004582 [Trapelia coarctata]|nr:hypothetical protein [Trapelia coarctata]